MDEALCLCNNCFGTGRRLSKAVRDAHRREFYLHQDAFSDRGTPSGTPVAIRIAQWERRSSGAGKGPGVNHDLSAAGSSRGQGGAVNTSPTQPSGGGAGGVAGASASPGGASGGDPPDDEQLPADNGGDQAAAGGFESDGNGRGGSDADSVASGMWQLNWIADGDRSLGAN